MPPFRLNSRSGHGTTHNVPHIIAISNQKGGVGKTTSAVSISTELALAGFRTLLIDFDPQGSATSGLGVQPTEGEDLYDVFFSTITLSEILKPTDINGLTVAPASSDLVGLEIELGKTPGRELILKSQISLLRSPFDFIIIDCPPSSGLLTLNAMGAAEHVLIPLQAEYYALEGISALMRTIEFVRHTFNPQLQILGVFMTMYDGRTNLSVQVEAEARKFFADKMLEAKIPRNIKLSECPSHGLPIALYDPNSSGARAYKSLTEEIIARFGAQSGNLAANG
jgi:chromosome partitioning protein